MPDLIPYGAGANKALEPTFREAIRLGHNYVGTEHILLALLELEAEPRDSLGVGRQSGTHLAPILYRQPQRSSDT